MTTFQILGRVCLRPDHGSSEALDVKGVKARALLVTLLLRAGTTVSLDRLAEALWDEEPPRSAVANIRTHASRLRRSFDARTALLGTVGGYELQVDADRCDHLRFLDRAAAGRAALEAGDPARAAGRLAAALALWQGDEAAVGVPRNGPLAAWLGHLDEERMRAVEDFADAQLQLAEPRSALRDLAGLLAAAPLRGRAWELRMRAHHRLGEIDGVTAAYRAAEAVHRRELGTGPGARLDALYRSLVNSAPVPVG
ncbi:AfsR/SARP family transcriptional regulator [Streptomyces sp. NRRL B-24484]|uniref:AfsR/SARP family transcriptional regulator n=1 Tax=Streptomyces sp. NRRL B-24484 TaxID=1463833 RepID=UPI0004BEFD25|nr:BTAD domain-containing putative transcriptional regulator [Streptomyces sp. NRRL B-24484]